MDAESIQMVIIGSPAILYTYQANRAKYRKYKHIGCCFQIHDWTYWTANQSRNAKWQSCRRWFQPMNPLVSTNRRIMFPRLRMLSLIPSSLFERWFFDVRRPFEEIGRRGGMSPSNMARDHLRGSMVFLRWEALFLWCLMTVFLRTEPMGLLIRLY